jgi:hypothetical protein
MTRPVDPSRPVTLKYLLSKVFGHIVPVGVVAVPTAGAQATTAAVLGSAYDAAGGLRITSIGAANAAGVLATVAFGTAYETAPKAVLLTARTANAIGIGLYVSAISTTGFTVSCASAPAATTVYDLSYAVVG